MQTFAEWLEAKLHERGWTAADLTRASQTDNNPRGIDSGLISRWRRPAPRGTVPRAAQTLTRLARALEVSEHEVYQAAGLHPPDGEADPREQITARRQAVRDQLDRWLNAVGPDYEELFWRSLKDHGDTAARTISAVRTAVSGTTEPAVSAAVSGRARRGRRPRGSGSSPLAGTHHTIERLRATAQLVSERLVA